jgi:hypothetical protein
MENPFEELLGSIQRCGDRAPREDARVKAARDLVRHMSTPRVAAILDTVPLDMHLAAMEGLMANPLAWGGLACMLYVSARHIHPARCALRPLRLLFPVLHVACREAAAAKAMDKDGSRLYLAHATSFLERAPGTTAFLSPRAMAFLIRSVASHAIVHGVVERVLPVLEAVHAGFPVASTCLTPAHPELVKLFILSRRYARAREFLRTSVRVAGRALATF